MFGNILPAFTVAGMRTLAAAPLRELHLDAVGLDDRCIEPLLGHPALANLELPGACITAPGARVLGSLPQLRRLEIPESTLDDLGVAALAPLAGQLQSLHLGGATSLTDAACETLSALERLAFLDIGSTQIGGAGIRMLSQLRDLEQLDLRFLDLVADDVLALAPHAKLRELSLYMCHRITDRAIDAIERLSLLAHLDLGGTQITREAIDRLARMPRIHTIGLEACDPRAIAHARTFEHWNVVDHGPASIDEPGLA
jgi:hypothetical protein